ncbi:putative reverse transcriptase domain-containing protein [Tanacetum coccineum]
MPASMEARIAEHAVTPIPPTSPTYDQAPLGHRAAMIRMRDDIPKEDMPPQRRFVLTAPPLGYDIAESSAAAARASRATDKAEAVGYIRALQTSEHRMMTSIKEVNLRVNYQAQVRGQESEIFYTQLHDARTDRRDIRLEIDVWPYQARLETLETHMSRMEWQRQRAEDDAVRQIMRTQNLKVRRNDVAAYTQRFQELALMCTKFLTGETKKVDKYISGLPDNIHGNVMQNDNKRKADDSSRNNQQPHKKQNVVRAYTVGPGEKKAYTGNLPLCTKCNYHHTGKCAPKCGNCKSGHIKKNCLKLKNHGNGNENGVAQGRAYALGGRDASPDSNVITGTFLLNNRYATILFDIGADRSFVSTTFSSLINITPTTLENHYDVELAIGKIIGVNTIIRGCTLNFMNHPFNIDLMSVPLGIFDVIIGMDWLTKYHGVIICDEKIVCVPFGREMLIFQGNGNNQKEKSRLNIISCTKAQEYLSKGCDVFLAHITTKEAKDKWEGKRLEDMPIVKDFPEVFLEDLSGIPPARQVEFQNDLVPGAAPVARAPYRLAPSEMKELAKQL